MRILYDSKNLKYKTPFGCLKAGEVCSIRLDIPSSCMAKEVILLFINEHTGKEHRFSMSFMRKEDMYDIYSLKFSIDCAGLYFYKFLITDENTTFELYKEGKYDTNIGSGDMWQLSVYEKDFCVPNVFKGKVMYQIFPDRFNKEGDCDLKNKLTPFYIHENKNDTPHFKPNENGEVLNNDFYGGNLKGIEKKLAYIKSLGVSIIYLNPIFKAFSNHRYDTCDYKKIDEMLGTEADFISLCKAAYEMGIKIILDGVFSHTGSNSIYFDSEKIFGTGAVSNENSPYRQWYNFSEYPHKFDAWWGIKTLPAVNELNDGYLDYIIRDNKSVISHWLKLGADGFRLDVADELPDEFIYLLRKRVKEIKKESFVLGEVWEDASNKISYGKRRKYFVGSELDSVMNYCFKNAIIDFVCGKIAAEDFAYRVMEICENYPADSLNSLMNFLSTHDTARIINSLSGCEMPNTKEKQAEYKLSKEERSLGTQRLFTAAFLEFVLPGNACIYYGDEIAMEGFGDPFCRRYYEWDNKNEETYLLFKSLGEMKNSCPALQNGDIGFEITDSLMIIKRSCNSEVFKAVINLSDEAHILKGKCVICHNADKLSGATVLRKGGFVAFKE
ncbi:MAG: glycoside hydrolase family 13 protein [Clostridia bacterium]|nr:glycoside hydrolase family 13 protein [Clostridia bacterium]